MKCRYQEKSSSKSQMTALSFCVICFNITETMARLDDNISHCERVVIRIFGNLGINLNPVIT